VRASLCTTQCADLQEARRESGVYVRTMMGGTPTWEEWMAKGEAPNTRKYVQAIGRRWGERGKKPWLGSLDAEGGLGEGDEESEKRNENFYFAFFREGGWFGFPTFDFLCAFRTGLLGSCGKGWAFSDVRIYCTGKMISDLVALS